MTDYDIVRLFNDRSESAISETDMSYGSYLRYISYEILRNDQDCEEIVNDTYHKAWESIPPNQPESLKNYLAKIVRRLSINRLEFKLAQKRGGGQYEFVIDELSSCVPKSYEDTTDSMVIKEVINDYLRSLSDTKRRIFVRRYWYLSPISEIAADYSMSEGRVKMILMRLRNDLKKKLEMEGITV